MVITLVQLIENIDHPEFFDLLLTYLILIKSKSDDMNYPNH